MAATTSDRVFVWFWLPGETEPVPAGVLERRDKTDDLSFRYGDLYAERADAISLYTPQLPLRAKTWFSATENLTMPGCLRDASPDAWGRRVIASRLLGKRDEHTDPREVDYLLGSS